MLGLISGAVTPLGLLNDREHTVPFWLGKSFLKCSGRVKIFSHFSLQALA